ncbi:ATP-NAD kinase [Halodesulfurarchaeum sp. HSR-GB]|uniref:ATP-NAD kinase n=1 Tax=Halodesulfurarchaeum sp. HSR-GB TaxID=3074077 RepID=UPI002864CA66|nr:ATP-NAD kinase [Halodesulfurarchaeum sp. HSR-GB]MDR5657187.1 ATP-NAD kinase [Halodesulfurarchaeum sp. HSR-GB]
MTIVGPEKCIPTGLESASEADVDHVERVSTADPPESDFLVTVGESALLSAVTAAVQVPIVPVAVDAGVPTVPLSDLAAAISALVAGESTIETVPTIVVSLGENTYRALMDVMAVTAEPARISEFRTRKVETDVVVDQVRADGIVAAAAAGTPGYGTAAGGPILDPELDGLAVVPVGPFRTERPQWVLAPPIEFEVVRESVPVSLVVDDDPVERVPAGEPVRLDWGEPIEIAVLEATIPPLANDPEN